MSKRNSVRARRSNFKTYLLVTGSALVVGAVPGAALAQQTSDGSGTEVDELVITGFRKSLSEARDIKRDSVIQMDVIVAEDMAKFTECDQRSPVMPAAEVQLLVDDLLAELTTATDAPEARMRAAQFSMVLDGFVRDWRQLCALHGVGGRGRPEFLRLAGAMREAAYSLAEGLSMRTNNASAMLVLEKRVLQHLVADQV